MNESVLNVRSSVSQNYRKLLSPWALIALIIALIIMLVPEHAEELLSFAAQALAFTLPYILFAVVLIGMLKATGAEHALAIAFQGKEYCMIVLASLFGGLAPFCSCEVIPFVAGLIAAGAPLSAIMAFWLSSPLIDPPTLFITAAALGWHFAIAKAVFAVGIGLLGGMIIVSFNRAGFLHAPAKANSITSCCSCGPAFGSNKPYWKFWQESERIDVFKSVAQENTLFLVKWLTLAYLLESLMIAYVPAEVIGSVVGGEGIFPIVISAIIGAPAYLNSYIAPPLVAGLIEQGMSNGAGMAFMISGAVSSIPAMIGVYSLVRLPVFISYIGLGFLGAVVSGVLFMMVI